MTEPHAFIERLHTGAMSGVLAVSGGGSLLLSDLLTVPGASNSVLEAVVPYAPSSLARFLGAEPEQACSGATARAMAVRAFERALLLAPGAQRQRFGLAVTASLRTTRPKRGAHRAYVALQTLEATRE